MPGAMSIGPVPTDMQTTNVPVLDLDGSPHQRGIVHGESVRGAICDALRAMHQSIGDTYGVNPRTAIAEFLAHTQHRELMRSMVPDLYDEIVGIAQGAACPVEDLWAHNLIDELWCFGFKDRASSWQGPFNKCSVVAFAADAHNATVAGQNIDIASWYDGYQVVLRVPATDGESAAWVVSVAGVIGLAGLSARGVGVCVNALFDLEHGSRGLPVAAHVRRVLSARSLEEASGRLVAGPHASGQHYLLSNPTSVLSLECSANQVVTNAAAAGDGTLVCHTNHALTNGDTGTFERLLERCPPERKQQFLASSISRLAAVRNEAAQALPDGRLAAIKTALASRSDAQYPVSRDARTEAKVSWHTVASVIYEFGQHDSHRVHFAAGPPHSSDYVVAVVA